MSMNKTPPSLTKKIVAQKEALPDYLGSLLGVDFGQTMEEEAQSVVMDDALLNGLTQALANSRMPQESAIAEEISIQQQVQPKIAASPGVTQNDQPPPANDVQTPEQIPAADLHSVRRSALKTPVKENPPSDSSAAASKNTAEQQLKLPPQQSPAHTAPQKPVEPQLTAATNASGASAEQSSPAASSDKQTTEEHAVKITLAAGKDKHGNDLSQELIPRSERLRRLREARHQNNPQLRERTPPLNPAAAPDSTLPKTCQPDPEPVQDERGETNESQFMIEFPTAARQLNLPDVPNVFLDEPPSVDLSLFLPNVPSDEEIASVEKKKKEIENEKLRQALVRKAKENELLQQELEQTRQALQDFTRQQPVDYSPEWANPSFQVMMFSVANLKLAIALKDLSNIIVWDEKYITEMPGHAQWYLGLVQHRGKNVPVIDTVQQVIPPNRLAGVMKNRRELKHIIMINDEQWGLACDQINGIVTLAADAVKWRSERTARRWLLGTVKDQMCALLDAEEFALMLKTGEGSLIPKTAAGKPQKTSPAPTQVDTKGLKS